MNWIFVLTLNFFELGKVLHFSSQLLFSSFLVFHSCFTFFFLLMYALSTQNLQAMPIGGVAVMASKPS